MAPTRYEDQSKTGEVRPASLQLLIALGVLIVVLGLINDHSILFVVILYLLVILEGILCAIYLFGRESIFGDNLTKNRNNDHEFGELLVSNQRLISPIATFLRSAVRGSEFSRHEVARIISDTVFEKFGERDSSGRKTLKPEILALLSKDEQFRGDFQSVVYAYLPGGKAEHENAHLSSSSYSQSMKRLVTRLSDYETKPFLVSNQPIEKTKK